MIRKTEDNIASNRDLRLVALNGDVSYRKEGTEGRYLVPTNMG